MKLLLDEFNCGDQSVTRVVVAIVIVVTALIINYIIVKNECKDYR